MVMGQVVRSAVTEVTESALARRRTRKSRQSQHNNAYFTGNLNAFHQSQRRATSTPATPPLTSSAAQNHATVVPTQTTDKPSDKPSDKPEAQSVPESAAQLAHHQVPASNDSFIARGTTTPRFGLRSKIATAVLAGLATGAVVGGFLTSNSQPEQALTSNDSLQSQSTSAEAIGKQAIVSPEIVSPEIVAPEIVSPAIVAPEIVDDVPPEPQISLQPDSIPIVPDKDPVAEELAAKREQATHYREEIEWLHIQNGSLRQEVDALDNETTELNAELLELELAVSALESKAAPTVETRTVYNFVNVPLGGSVDQTASPTTGAEQNNYPPTDSDEYYSEENVDYYREENADYYNDENGDLPEEFLDYHSGEVVETQDQIDSVSENEQLIYDPDSGYYINPHYVESDEEPTGPSGSSREFPPVLYPDDP